MRFSLALSLTLLLFLGAARPRARAEEDGEVARVVALIDLLGLYEDARARIRDAIVPLHAAHPLVPEDFWAERFDALSRAAFLRRVVPVFRARLRPVDVRALLRFGQTPAGRRALRALPGIRREARAATLAWSRAFLDATRQLAEERGYRF